MLDKLLKEYEYLLYKEQKTITYLLCWGDDLENGVAVPERHYNKMAELQKTYSDKIKNLESVLRHEHKLPECMLDCCWHVAMNKAAQHKYHC